MRQISTSIIVAVALSLCFSACGKSSLNPNEDGNAPGSEKKTVVHVAGKVWSGENFSAAYWKDGVLTKLTDGIGDAYAGGMAIVGKDVYITGYDHIGNNPVATYWKNGISTKLTKDDEYSTSSWVRVQWFEVYGCLLEKWRAKKPIK